MAASSRLNPQGQNARQRLHYGLKVGPECQLGAEASTPTNPFKPSFKILLASRPFSVEVSLLIIVLLVGVSDYEDITR